MNWKQNQEIYLIASVWRSQLSQRQKQICFFLLHAFCPRIEMQLWIAWIVNTVAVDWIIFITADICGFCARGSDQTDDESVWFLTLDRVHVTNGQLTCCQFNLLFLHQNWHFMTKNPKKQLPAVESVHLKFKIEVMKKITSFAGKSIVVETHSNAKLSPKVRFEATNVVQFAFNNWIFFDLMHFFHQKLFNRKEKKNCQKIAQVKDFHHALAKGCLLI